MQGNGTVIRMDGSIDQIELPEDFAGRLKKMQEIVGGYLQAVALPDGTFVLMNEEGKLIGLPINEVATSIAHVTGSIAADDCIVGDVLIVHDESLG